MSDPTQPASYLGTARMAVAVELDGRRYYSPDVQVTHYTDGTVTLRPADGWEASE